MLDVNGVIETVAALAHPVLSETIEFTIKIAADLWPCCVDQAELELALLNLVINARDAMDGNGRIVLSAENTSIAADVPDLVHGDYVCLSVRDTGCGMSPEVSARVFEPFFTTKDPGKGSGWVYQWSMASPSSPGAQHGSRALRARVPRCILYRLGNGFRREVFALGMMSLPK